MRKRFLLMSMLIGSTSLLYAQVVQTTAANPLRGDTVNRPSNLGRVEDKSSFTFSESQLNEDDDAIQSSTAVNSSNDDIFLSNSGYLFSPMRFKVRAYDSKYNDMLVNGLLLNDAETGRFSYGMIGGLNDATRNQEGASYGEQNVFGYSPIGGASNINLRASQYAPGSKASLSACNRNYVARAMYTFSTGLKPSGWAFTGSASYRWAQEGVIEGTFYNAFSYFLSAQKILNSSHSLSFTTWGAPTERAQQSAATEEAFWLANSHYYNPYWGYQDGKKRSSRVVNSYEPVALVTWDWKMNKESKLTTSASFKYSKYSTTGLGWNGNAADPRPDYYKYLPSSVYNVWDTSVAPTTDEYNQWLQLYDYWKASKENRQINWDQMYFDNAQANATGGQALYYVEKRHNDQWALNLSSVFNKTLNTRNKYTLGLNLNHTTGMHYKTMDDLLGANTYIDVDKFSVRDYGVGNSATQNDLDNPNRVIKEGDKFGYDYDIYVNKARLFGTYFYQPSNALTIFVGGNLDGSTMERYGNMRNGRAPGKSKGSSGTAYFLAGGGKVNATWRINAGNIVSLTAGYSENAPMAYDAFIAPRIKNDFADNLRTEGILNGELSYLVKLSRLTGKVSGYYTKFYHGIELSQFYNDQESRFTYLTLNDIEKVHYGVEAALTYNVTSSLSFTAIGSVNNAKYTNNPNGTLTYESESESNKSVVYMDGVKENSTPLTALSIGADYNISGWFFSANLNYYDGVYVAASTYRRLGTVMKSYALTSYDANGQPVYDVTAADLSQYGGILLDANGKVSKVCYPHQEKCDGGFMLDASIGRYIRLKNGKSLSINLSVSNILNNTDLCTGGYEQNRDDHYTSGETRTYLFSKNSKYYYANAFNAFLNVGFRF